MQNLHIIITSILGEGLKMTSYKYFHWSTMQKKIQKRHCFGQLFIFRAAMKAIKTIRIVVPLLLFSCKFTTETAVLQVMHTQSNEPITDLCHKITNQSLFETLTWHVKIFLLFSDHGTAQAWEVLDTPCQLCLVKYKMVRIPILLVIVFIWICKLLMFYVGDN